MASRLVTRNSPRLSHKVISGQWSQSALRARKEGGVITVPSRINLQTDLTRAGLRSVPHLVSLNDGQNNKVCIRLLEENNAVGLVAVIAGRAHRRRSYFAPPKSRDGFDCTNFP